MAKLEIPYYQERQSIVNTCLMLSKSGFLAGLGGNVALRLSTNEFAVTPSAADYYTMTAEDICLLELNSLKRIDNNGRRESVEAGLHAALLRGRPDLNASVHTHQPIASAVSLIHVSIPVDTSHQSVLGNEVRHIKYAPSGSKALVQSLKRSLQPKINSYLLPNHGLVCAANTLNQAIENVAIIEKLAANFLITLIQKNQNPTMNRSLLSKIESHLEQAL